MLEAKARKNRNHENRSTLLLRWSSLILCVMLICCTVSFAAAEEDHLQWIDLDFWSMGSPYHWTFPYNDDWFTMPSDRYDHQLAQGSFGLMVSGFPRGDLGIPNKEILEDYYAKTGFEDAAYFAYEEQPGEYTIANGIARKKIGDVTLLALVVRGEGYGDEWVSNLTVGTEARHEGFNMAAQMVEERLNAYINQFNIQGEIRLWITGFSRSAATANIVAADCTDSGTFSAVYAYCFATPATTREKKEYNNIFNIIGKYDPVPKVPLSDWSFGRYGTDLYTPAQRIDSDYETRRLRAEKIYRQLSGKNFYSTPVLHSVTDMLLYYLTELVPAQSEYASLMQPVLIQAWRSMKNAGQEQDLISMLTTAVQEILEKDVNRKTEYEGFLSYLLNLGTIFSSDKVRDVFGQEWDDTIGMKNLFREHLPVIYMSWLFSGDRAEDVFTDATFTTVLYLQGVEQAEIFREDGYACTIHSNGTLTVETPGRPVDHLGDAMIDFRPFYQIRDESLIISLPRDNDCAVRIIPDADNTLRVTTLNLFCTTAEATATEEMDRVIDPAQECYIYFPASTAGEELPRLVTGGSTEVMISSGVVPASTFTGLAKVNLFNLSFQQIQNIALVMIIVLGVLVLLWLYSLIRSTVLKKRGRRAMPYMENVIGAALFTTLQQVSSIYLRILPVLSLIFGILAMLCIMTMCVSMMRQEYKQLSRFVIVALALSVVSSILMNRGMMVPSTYVYLAACLVIAVGLWLERKPGKREILLWIGISILLCIPCVIHRMLDPLVKLAVFMRLIAIIWITVGMNVSAHFLPSPLRVMLLVFIIPNMLGLYEYHIARNDALRLIGMILWAVILLSMCGVMYLRGKRAEKSING